jgi:hypothetical protein
MTEYTESSELHEALTDMLADPFYTEFNPLREHEVKITSCLRVRHNKDGEDIPPAGDPTTLKKVTELEKLYLDADYIVVIDNYSWNNAKSKLDQNALLHQCLMRIEIEVTEKGILKKTKKPDVIMFSATAGRFGPLDDKQINLREMLTLGAKEAAKRLGPPKTPEQKEDESK